MESVLKNLSETKKHKENKQKLRKNFFFSKNKYFCLEILIAKYNQNNTMPISEAEKKYLLNKHQGGENSSKGAHYEQFYLVYQVISLLCLYDINEGSGIAISTQVPMTFVDDLVITFRTLKKSYYQLKDVKQITWNKDLKYDFKRQEEVSEENNEDFTLTLVASNDEKVKNVPQELSHTQTENFPATETINELVWRFPLLQKKGKELLGEGADISQISDFATIISGCLADVKLSYFTLQEIAKKIEEVSKGFYNFSVVKTYTLGEENLSVLDAIDGIAYTINRDQIEIHYGNWRLGPYQISPSFEEELMRCKPTDIKTLIEMLHSWTNVNI